MSEQTTIADIQREHRRKLIQAFRIQPGARILEIGCGQGDTTEALAEAVGKEGFVHGVDIAPGSYGAPETLEEAHRRLRQGPLGPRIRADFLTDVLDDSFQPIFDRYDCAALSHCTWYMRDLGMVQAILARLRTLTDRLCLAEWDIHPHTIEQYPHHLAAQVQAFCQAYRSEDVNIVATHAPSALRRAAQDAGWTVESESTLDSPDLQDGTWEADIALSEVPKWLNDTPQLPATLRQWLEASMGLLQTERSKGPIRPLSAWVLLAR